jgi:hypothetical protein
MQHLAHLESVGIAMKQHIERETGACVLVITGEGHPNDQISEGGGHDGSALGVGG